MNKRLAFKLIFVAAMLFAAYTIYSDENQIKALKADLEVVQKNHSAIAEENKILRTQLDECCSHKDSLPPVAENGKYSDQQIDEMERKIRLHNQGK